MGPPLALLILPAPSYLPPPPQRQIPSLRLLPPSLDIITMAPKQDPETVPVNVQELRNSKDAVSLFHFLWFFFFFSLFLCRACLESRSLGRVTTRLYKQSFPNLRRHVAFMSRSSRVVRDASKNCRKALYIF